MLWETEVALKNNLRRRRSPHRAPRLRPRSAFAMWFVLERRLTMSLCFVFFPIFAELISVFKNLKFSLFLNFLFFQILSFVDQWRSELGAETAVGVGLVVGCHNLCKSVNRSGAWVFISMSACALRIIIWAAA